MLAVLYIWFFLVLALNKSYFWVLLFEQRSAQSLGCRCRQDRHFRPLPLHINTWSVYRCLLLYHSAIQPCITQESCGSGTCHFASCYETRVQRFRQDLQTFCATCAMISPPTPFPYSPSSPVLFSTTVSPHRNPAEQPGESPRIHRRGTAEPRSNNYTNRHGHTCPHVTPLPNTTFHMHQLVF